jgi:heme oxygenase (mycobilin-producing)
MSVVRINAIDVPEGMGDELERRFAARAGEVEKMPGFEGFELLRPTGDHRRYFVYTRWRDQESFDAWAQSAAFGRGHGGEGGDRPAPVAQGAELLSFDVVLSVEGPGSAPS